MTNLCNQCKKINCKEYILKETCYNEKKIKKLGLRTIDKNLIDCKSECEKEKEKKKDYKKDISKLKKNLMLNKKTLKNFKLTDSKSECSNVDLSKKLSSNDISYKKWPSYKCTEFLPNSSILTYENAKNSCNMNKKCKAISNKNCNKKGFQLCSSSVIKQIKDCGCVYIKDEKKLDRLGKSEKDIKYAISLVNQDIKCPLTHPYRSNLLGDLTDTNDIKSGNRCVNTAACAASKSSNYKQISLGFKCNDISMKNIDENKKIKKDISKLQKKQILLDYKINKNKNKKEDLSTISKENEQLLKILIDELNFRKKEVSDINLFIKNKNQQIDKLKDIKRTYAESLKNLSGKEKEDKIKSIENMDDKIKENNESLKLLETKVDTQIKKVFSLTEKILLTRKNTINSKNDVIIMKANIKKDKKIKDSFKNKEDYLKIKHHSKKNNISSLKINDKIKYLQSSVKKDKKKLAGMKDTKGKDMIKDSINFQEKDIVSLKDELSIFKKEDILLKKKLELVEEKINVNVKEAKLIKKDTELKKDETKIKMTKKENVNDVKLENIINNKKDVLKEKKKIIKSKLKIIKNNNKINKKNKKLILEKTVNIQNKIIDIKKKKKKVNKMNKEFDKLKKEEKIAEENLKKIRQMLYKFNSNVESKSSESKEMVIKSRKIMDDIKNLNNEIVKNKFENQKLKSEIKKNKKDIKKDEHKISFYSKTLKSIRNNTIVHTVTKHYQKNSKQYLLFFIFFIFMVWALLIKKDESEVFTNY